MVVQVQLPGRLEIHVFNRRRVVAVTEITKLDELMDSDTVADCWMLARHEANDERVMKPAGRTNSAASVATTVPQPAIIPCFSGSKEKCRVGSLSFPPMHIDPLPNGSTALACC